MERRLYSESRKGGRESFNAPGLGPLLISVFVVHFGLVFWLLMTFSVVPLRFGQLREVWKPNVPLGTSVFELCILIVSLLLVLVIIDAWAFSRRTSKVGWFSAIGYLSCVVVVGAIGRNLYEFARIPLNDEWYYSQIRDEPIDGGWVLLGRVLERGVQGCNASVSECVLVELDSGVKTTVGVKPEVFGAYSPIVAIEKGYGRYSGEVTLQVYAYVPVDDVELFWRREKRR